MNAKPGPQRATNQPGSVTPPLLLRELSQRCMDNAAIAALVLDKFEKQLQSDILDLERCLASRDLGEVARRAHALKGAAGAVAAPQVRELAAQVEALAKQGQHDAIVREMSALRAEMKRCLEYLPAARTTLKGGSAGLEPGR